MACKYAQNYSNLQSEESTFKDHNPPTFCYLNTLKIPPKNKPTFFNH